MSFSGTVQSVDTTTAGDVATVDVTVGATFLPVEDVTSFDAEGGLVSVGGSTLAYSTADVAGSQLVLTAPTVAQIAAGDRVDVFPALVTKTALVSLGGDGDAVSADVPFTMDALLPDGFRDAGMGEPVILDEVRPGSWAISDVRGRSAVVSSSQLSQGDVDPTKLTVGQTDNLITDANGNEGSRPLPDEWSLTPMAEAPGVKGFRCQARDIGVATTPYQSETDHSLSLSADPIPVLEGRAVRVKVLVRADPASAASSQLDSGGVAYPVTARIRVVFYAPGNGQEPVSGPGHYLDAVIGGDVTTSGMLYPLTNVFTVPVGYTYVRLYVQTTHQTAGAIDFFQPVMQFTWDKLESPDYVQGVQGYAFNNESSQVQNLNVLGSVGAGHVSAESIDLNGVDILDLIDRLPKGLLRCCRTSTVTNTALIGATETVLWEFHTGPVKAGRAYEFQVHGHIDGDTSNTNVRNDSFDVMIKYNGDGTSPTTSSAIMDGSLTKVPIPAEIPRIAFIVLCTYFPQADYENLRLALTMRRVQGEGLAQITVTDINRCTEFRIFDMGRYSAPLTEGLAQKSKANGAAADPTPSSAYEIQFPIIWAKSFDGNGSPRDPDDETVLNIGFASTLRARARGMFGFNDAAIRSALIGVTPFRITLTFKVKATYAASGVLNTNLFSHTASARPAGNFPLDGTTFGRAAFGNLKQGSTYTFELPLAMANEFKSGATRSLGFYAVNDAEDGHGHVWGNTSVYEPVLKIYGNKTI